MCSDLEKQHSGSSPRYIIVRDTIVNFLAGCIQLFALQFVISWCLGSYILTRKSQISADTPKGEVFKRTTDLNWYANEMDIELEIFDVITKDSFHLKLYHLKSKTPTELPRPPILLFPGLLMSTIMYISFTKSSVGYYLHSKGLDVWLAENRGGYNLKHDSLKPSDPKFWD